MERNNEGLTAKQQETERAIVNYAERKKQEQEVAKKAAKEKERQDREERRAVEALNKKQEQAESAERKLQESIQTYLNKIKAFNKEISKKDALINKLSGKRDVNSKIETIRANGIIQQSLEIIELYREVIKDLEDGNLEANNSRFQKETEIRNRFRKETGKLVVQAQVLNQSQI